MYYSPDIFSQETSLIFFIKTNKRFTGFFVVVCIFFIFFVSLLLSSQEMIAGRWYVQLAAV